MKNQNKLLLVSLAFVFGMLFVVPSISAAIAWATPTAGTNHSSDVAVSVTFTNGTDFTDPLSANTTLYHNSSGSWASVACGSFAANTSTASCTLDITSIADIAGVALNMTLGNVTTTDGGVTVSGLTIDDTNPAISASVLLGKLSVGSTNELTWSTSDATSGLSSVTTTLTSPDTSRCATKTYTDTAATYTITGAETTCSGTYTMLVSATDIAGNTGTSTVTFKTNEAGNTKSGSNTLGDTATSKTNKSKNELIAIVIILAIFAYFLMKK